MTRHVSQRHPTPRISRHKHRHSRTLTYSTTPPPTFGAHPTARETFHISEPNRRISHFRFPKNHTATISPRQRDDIRKPSARPRHALRAESGVTGLVPCPFLLHASVCEAVSQPMSACIRAGMYSLPHPCATSESLGGRRCWLAHTRAVSRRIRFAVDRRLLHACLLVAASSHE